MNKIYLIIVFILMSATCFSADYTFETDRRRRSEYPKISDQLKGIYAYIEANRDKTIIPESTQNIINKIKAVDDKYKAIYNDITIYEAK